MHHGYDYEKTVIIHIFAGKMTPEEKEYYALLASFEAVPYSVDEQAAKMRICEMESNDILSKMSYSVFDIHSQKHIIESPCHRAMFSCPEIPPEEMDVHPDDRLPLLKNGLSALRHFFIGNSNADDCILIREYRARVFGSWQRIQENLTLLETDSNGNIWLGLSVFNISADQSESAGFKSSLFNRTTGAKLLDVERYSSKKSILTPKETEVLRLIREGRFSKEIASSMNISLNTVNTHRQRILEKLSVDNAIEAVRAAEALGILS